MVVEEKQGKGIVNVFCHQLSIASSGPTFLGNGLPMLGIN